MGKISFSYNSTARSEFVTSPLKILLVNSGPPDAGGGTRIYCGNLSREFIGRGHRVFYFAPDSYDLVALERLRKRSFNGVEVAELVNSPVAPHDLLNPASDIQNARMEKVFRRYLEAKRPDIVHFHDFLGLCSSLVRVAKDMGFVTIVTHHNYWFVCPNTYLFNERRENCIGPNDGSNCVRCISSTFHLYDKSAERTISKRMRNSLRLLVLQLLGGRTISFLKRKDRSTESNIDNASRRGGKGNTPDAVVTPPAAQYLERYMKNIGILNAHCDLNIAVSREVRSVLTDHGLDAGSVRVIPIGTRAAEKITPKEISGRSGRIVFGYIGPIIYLKGLHILISAFAKLDQAEVALHVHGWGDGEYENQLRMASRNLNVKFFGPYMYDDINEILGTIDVGVVPPLWKDNGPQVVFEFLAAKIPIVGSKIGGIPDFVEHGVNGFLFEPGDAESLAVNLRKFSEAPELIKIMSGRIGKQKTMQEHAVEIESLYASLLSRGPNQINPTAPSVPVKS